MVYHSIEQRLERYKTDLERAPTKKESKQVKAIKKFFIDQKGMCICCKKKFEGHEKPVLDHIGPLKNEEWRGIVCENCDIIIRHSRENVSLLKNIINYLEKGGTENILSETMEIEQLKGWDQLKIG